MSKLLRKATGVFGLLYDLSENSYDFEKRVQNDDYSGLTLQAIDTVSNSIDVTSLLPYMSEDFKNLFEFYGIKKDKGILSSFTDKIMTEYDEKNPEYKLSEDQKNEIINSRVNNIVLPSLLPNDEENFERVQEITDNINNKQKNVNVPSLLEAIDKTAQFDNKLLSKNREKLEYFEDNGIISRTQTGKSSVSNWYRTNKLNTSDLLILSLDSSLNDEDKVKINEILKFREKNKIIIPENSLSFSLDEPVIFSDTDVLSYNLFKSKNEFDEFILQNPFTDENSTIQEKEDEQGNKWKEIKYIDDELNLKYVELKQKYDSNYKKFVELREKQIKNIGDFREVEGQVLTEQEYFNFNQNPQNYGNNLKLYVEQIRNIESSNSAKNYDSNFYNVTVPPEALPAKERIKGAEGLRLEAYPDAGGYAIGYGHTIVKGEEYLFNGITEQQAEEIFEKDFKEYYLAATQIPGYDIAPKQVQNALIDMTYNMGKHWISEWPTFGKHLKNQEYEHNAEIIKGSLYSTQVGDRARQNAKIFLDASNDLKNNKSEKTKDNKQITPSSPQVPQAQETQENNKGITDSQPNKTTEFKQNNSVNASEFVSNPQKEVKNEEKEVTKLDNIDAENSKVKNAILTENTTTNLINITKVTNVSLVAQNVQNNSQQTSISQTNEDKYEEVSLLNSIIL